MKIWKLNYSYRQDMVFDAVRDDIYYCVVAEDENQALKKGDKIFANLSEYHERLVNGEKIVNDNGDPHGYGILSDLEKKALVLSSHQI
jgi:hypothetical protein